MSESTLNRSCKFLITFLNIFKKFIEIKSKKNLQKWCAKEKQNSVISDEIKDLNNFGYLTSKNEIEYKGWW